jgi:hypothetical protein
VYSHTQPGQADARIHGRLSDGFAEAVAGECGLGKAINGLRDHRGGSALTEVVSSAHDWVRERGDSHPQRRSPGRCQSG